MVFKKIFLYIIFQSWLSDSFLKKPSHPHIHKHDKLKPIAQTTTHCSFCYPTYLPTTTWDKRHFSCQGFSSITSFCCWFSPQQNPVHQGILPHFCIFSMVICVCAAHPRFPQTGRKLMQNLHKTQEKKAGCKHTDLFFWLPPQKHHRNCFLQPWSQKGSAGLIWHRDNKDTKHWSGHPGKDSYTPQHWL